jgi:ferritin-like metal-binding protein YciE
MSCNRCGGACFDEQVLSHAFARSGPAKDNRRQAEAGAHSLTPKTDAKGSTMETMKELFEHELADIRDAEMKLMTALQRMAKKVSAPPLKELLLAHREETAEQIQRLDQVFDELGSKPKREPCKGISGLIQEFGHIIREEDPADELVNLIAASGSIKVERYEISAYESLIEMANKLGLKSSIAALKANLQEEVAALKKLHAVNNQMLSELPAEALEESEVQE